MKNRMNTCDKPMNGWHVHDVTSFGTPVLIKLETQTPFFQHSSGTAAHLSEIEPISRGSKIMKFLRSL